MTVGKLLKHIPFMKRHFKVEWHAAQSVQEVLQRDGVQFPSFIRQMSRVGQDGVGVGGEQINSNYQWYMESWEMKIKAGGGSFDKRSVAKMMQLPLMPSKDSKGLWMQLRDKMDHNAQEKILLALKSMLIAVATKQAWQRMERLAKSGAAEGKFDVSCLLSEDEDSKGKVEDGIDWEAVSTLISAATDAAVGAGSVKRRRWWSYWDACQS